MYGGIIAALACLVLCGGCPGSLDNPGRFLDGGLNAACGDPMSVEVDIFQDSCAGSICHSPPEPSEGLDLISSGVADRVVDVEASGCAGKMIVSSSSPGDSYLLEKISGGQPSCGDPMPLAAPALSDDDLACVEAWVAEVAGGAM